MFFSVNRNLLTREFSTNKNIKYRWIISFLFAYNVLGWFPFKISAVICGIEKLTRIKLRKIIQMRIISLSMWFIQFFPVIGEKSHASYVCVHIKEGYHIWQFIIVLENYKNFQWGMSRIFDRRKKYTCVLLNYFEICKKKSNYIPPLSLISLSWLNAI